MLSSATLFHFTNNLETLKKILSQGFKPFYSAEDLRMFGIDRCQHIPMVSFCDIPLSQTQNHTKNYGCYAIGLSKAWGMRKNISPVHYIYKGSICATIVSEAYKSLPRDAFYVECGCFKFNPQTAIFFYGKPYHGHILRKDRTTDEVLDQGKVTFYDEREWRYIPFADKTIKGKEEIPPGVRAILSEEDYNKAGTLDRALESLHSHYKLIFRAKDIKYLIVKDEDEIPEMVDFIYNDLKPFGDNIDLLKCPGDERKRLTTRMISMCQIEQDF